jgi:hypothetical protein
VEKTPKINFEVIICVERYFLCLGPGRALRTANSLAEAIARLRAST